MARSHPAPADGPRVEPHPNDSPRPSVVLLLCYLTSVAERRKRSISLPPELDQHIEAAAKQAGMSYSGWLAAMARKEFIIQNGLQAVAHFEREHGSFTADELADAERWADDALKRAKRSGARQRRTA